jgi:hypothetical protein
MTPERARVRVHYQYLFNPKKTTLSKSEQSQFQKFLDEYLTGQNIMIDGGLIRAY